MSPTIFRSGPFRFYFFSREEPRMHVHVTTKGGEAKFWIEPEIKLAENHGLNSRQVNSAKRLVEANFDEIRTAWKTHFKS